MNDAKRSMAWSRSFGGKPAKVEKDG